MLRVRLFHTIKNANINTHTKERQTFKLKCFVCNSEHKVAVCQEFKKLLLDRKWDILKKNNLCRHCLNKHKGKCFARKECGIDGCCIKHHKLLHKSSNESNSSSRRNNTIQANNTTSEAINSHSTTSQNQNQIFRILPIRLYKRSGYINTYVFLDEGSFVSLIEKKVFDLLNVDGEEQSLCLRWTGNTTRQENASLKTSLNIANINNGDKFTLQCVHTVENLDLSQQTLNMKDMVKKVSLLNRTSYTVF